MKFIIKVHNICFNVCRTQKLFFPLNILEEKKLKQLVVIGLYYCQFSNTRLQLVN